MAVLLALISGAAHASWNALAKRAGKARPGTEKLATLVVLTVALGAGTLSIALVAWPLDALAMPVRALPYVALAGLGETAYVVSLGNAYQRGDLALTYAISRSTALVVIWPISWALFGTSPTWLAALATGLVIIGTVLARPRSTTTAAAGRVTWSVPWTLATGLSVGLYHAGYKGAVEEGGSPFVAFVLALSIAVPVLWWRRGAEAHVGSVREAFADRSLLVAGVLCATSFILLIIALTTADSGRMLGVRNSSVAFAAVLAFLMGERPTPREWAGISVAFGGIAVFAWDEALRAPS